MARASLPPPSALLLVAALGLAGPAAAQCPGITVDTTTPSGNPSAVPEAVIRAPYSATITETGTTAVAFTVSAGSLPAGLSLGSSGNTATISGTPTAAGDFLFTVRAVDANGCFGGRSYRLHVPCEVFLDCPGMDTECQTRSCNSGDCGFYNTQDGQLLSPANQIPGDCKERVCDGMGGIREIVDNTDLPLDDGNPCTAEVCNDGVPSHELLPPGTICGPGMTCSDGGVCK